VIEMVEMVSERRGPGRPRIEGRLPVIGEGQELRIRQVLRERGIRQDWLARQVGVSEAHVSRMLLGERRWLEDNRRKAGRALNWYGSLGELFAVLDGE